MIKNKYAAFALFTVLVILFWNLLDFLYASFITRSGYSFSGGLDLAAPFVAAVIMGYLLFLREK